MPRRRTKTSKTSKRPTHILKIGVQNDDDEKTKWMKVGAGWENAQGHIKISLNPAVTLAWGEGYAIYIFPNDIAED